MSASPLRTDIAGRSRQFSLVPIVLQKTFWGGERKYLEPLKRFTRGDVRGHIVSSKSITNRRSGIERQRSGGKA